MTWGLTYDDGPSPYTTGTFLQMNLKGSYLTSKTDLLNYLDANSLKTTFFIVGSRAISRPDIVQAEYAALHQVRLFLSRVDRRRSSLLRRPSQPMEQQEGSLPHCFISSPITLGPTHT